MFWKANQAAPLAAIIVAAVLTLPHLTYCTEWSSAQAIDARDGDYYASLVLDQDGNLHVAYLYTPSDQQCEIAYSTNESGEWASQTVAELPLFAGSRPDIAISSDQEPHIVYSTYETEPPKLAVGGAFFWQISDCPAEQVAHGAPLICLDDNDGCHIVFGYADGRVQYLYRSWLRWETEVLDVSASQVTGIAADSDSVPYIAYIDSEGNLECATIEDDDWETELVASPTIGLLGLWDSLAIDDSDGLHIAYLDGSPPLSSRLFYAHNSGTSWETYSLEEGGLWAQVAMGSEYNAQIAHVQSLSQGDETRYLFNDARGWHAEKAPIDRAGEWSLASVMTAMTADEEDVHIVYSGLDETADGGNALLYLKGKQTGFAAVVAADISLDDDSYKMNETMIVYAHVTNGLETASIEAKLWMKCPDGSLQSLLDPCSVFSIEAGTDVNIVALEYTFSGAESPGDYEVGARLVDPITGEEFSFDSEPFHFSAF